MSGKENFICMTIPEFESILEFKGNTDLKTYITTDENYKGELVEHKSKHKINTQATSTGFTPLKKKVDSEYSLVDELIDSLNGEKENDANQVQAKVNLATNSMQNQFKPSKSSNGGLREQFKPLELSNQQSSVLDYSIGGAGTGKSFALIELIKKIQLIYGKEAVHVTATTGIAAINIGGIKVQQFAGINAELPLPINGMPDKEAVLRVVSKGSSISKRWRDAKVLVIDEISMMSPALLYVSKYF